MKRFAALALIFLMLLPALSSCGGRAPALEEIYDRTVSLIDASHEINVLFFGEGLPTYPRITPLVDRMLSYSEKYGIYYLMFEDSDAGQLCMYLDKDTNETKFARVVNSSDVSAADGEPLLRDEETGLCFFATEYTEKEVEYVYSDEDDIYYNVVRADAEYLTIDEIKTAAEAVYSSEYLAGIYQAAFDGIISSGTLMRSRFYEQDGLLRQLKDAEPLIRARRVYDYSTMKIVRPSNAKYINITIDSHLEGESEILNVRLSLVLQEDGQWYLNSPTY